MYTGVTFIFYLFTNNRIRWKRYFWGSLVRYFAHLISIKVMSIKCSRHFYRWTYLEPFILTQDSLYMHRYQFVFLICFPVCFVNKRKFHFDNWLTGSKYNVFSNNKRTLGVILFFCLKLILNIDQFVEYSIIHTNILTEKYTNAKTHQKNWGLWACATFTTEDIKRHLPAILNERQLFR